MLYRAASFILLFILTTGYVFAQNSPNVNPATQSKNNSNKGKTSGFDTTAHRQYPMDIKYTTIGNNDKLVNIDSTLNNLYLQRPIEECFTCLDLGNVGLPSFDTRFSIPGDITQLSGISAFNKNDPGIDSLRFYTPKRPYADMYFTQGSKHEDQLTATFATHIWRNLFAGFNLHFASSYGFYTRQFSQVTNLSFYTQYISRDQHFTMRVGLIRNTMRTPVNGGVQSDTFFRDPQITQKDLEPVNLDTAYNRVRHTGVVWQTSYDFGRASIDSSHKIKKYNLDRKLRVQNTFEFEKYKYYFYDDSTDGNFYYVSLPVRAIYDSITQYKFNDEVGLYVNPKGTHYQTYVTAGVNYNRIFQPGGYNAYHQYFISGHEEGDVAHHLFYSLHGKIATEQSQTTMASYLFKGELIYHSHNFKKLTDSASVKDSTHIKAPHWLAGVSFIQEAAPPAFFQDNYYGSVYDWHNNFNNTLYTQANVFFKDRYVKLTLTYNHVNDYIYYGLDAMPHQTGTGIDILQASLQNRFKLARHIYNVNELLYQNISNTNIVSLPAFVMRSQIYFESDAFKKASHVQLGVMAHYWSDYYAPDYMPATMQFYLQQTSLMHYMPVFDVYASMKIKSARIFLRFENVTGYITKSVNFDALHYPMPDPIITFGINWILWN